jgi:hypothetical protein
MHSQSALENFPTDSGADALWPYFDDLAQLGSELLHQNLPRQHPNHSEKTR